VVTEEPLVRTRIKLLAATCLGVILSARAGGQTPVGPSAAGPERRYQNHGVFLLVVGQLDHDAHDVSLEVYDRSCRQWRRCGAFLVRSEGDVAVEGAITFRVKKEGEYLLRSIACDRAGNAEEKPSGPEAAEAVAVYDRTPPVVTVIGPPTGQTFAPGQQIEVTWKTREANPAPEKSVGIELSRDGGTTWSSLESGLDDTGSCSFAVPFRKGSVRARVTVTDRCGNRGSGVTPELTLSADAAARAPATPTGPSAADSGKPRRTVPPTPRDATGVEGARTKDAGRTAAPDRRPIAPKALAHHRLGAKALAAGKLTEAVRHLGEAILADARLEAAWSDMAKALEMQGKLKDADEILAGGEKRFADSAGFPYARGVLLVKMARPAEARKALGRAIKIDPRHAAAHLALATFAVEAGDLQTARTHWRAIVRSVPADSPLGKRAAQYLKASEQ
jgi:hypothetical protein